MYKGFFWEIPSSKIFDEEFIGRKKNKIKYQKKKEYEKML